MLALEPVAEMQADPNAYGFRPRRSAADAIAQCFNILAKRNADRWILEGDIKIRSATHGFVGVKNLSAFLSGYVRNRFGRGNKNADK